MHKFWFVHLWFVWGFMPACSIPLRYVHEFCILTCLTIVWMKDPLGMLEDSPGRRILLRSVLVMILIYHKVLMVYGPLGGGSLLEISWWCIAHWGTFLYWGIIIFFFLMTHWGLMLTPPSRGFYQLRWGNFILQLSRGLHSMSWTYGEVLLWYENLVGD